MPSVTNTFSTVDNFGQINQLAKNNFFKQEKQKEKEKEK